VLDQCLTRFGRSSLSSDNLKLESDRAALRGSLEPLPRSPLYTENPLRFEARLPVSLLPNLMPLLGILPWSLSKVVHHWAGPPKSHHLHYFKLCF
jgi:hypothetical protein